VLRLYLLLIGLEIVFLLKRDRPKDGMSWDQFMGFRPDDQRYRVAEKSFSTFGRSA
jgi:hypothetical protein